jgi:putative hydrolase of the HAD superfamily
LGPELVVVSNANGTIAEEMRVGKLCQVGDGVGQRMKAIIDSGAIGHINKPDPQIFKLALEAAETTCDRVVHIGDSAWSDMEGARRSGIAGIHINPTKSCTDESHFHANDILDAVQTFLV